MTTEPDKRLLVIGAGGHARVVIDVARAAGFEPVAALDARQKGAFCNGVEVVGGDEQAEGLFETGIRLCTVAIGDNRLRSKLADRLIAIGFSLPVLRHPSAVVSPSAVIGAGTVVMPLAVVNASATIGRMAIVNTSAVVEHDCAVGDGAHIAPGTRLGGCVRVGTCTLVGIGSAVRPETKIGDFAIIGAGSTVIEDIPDRQVAIGSPARIRRPS